MVRKLKKTKMLLTCLSVLLLSGCAAVRKMPYVKTVEEFNTDYGVRINTNYLYGKSMNEIPETRILKVWYSPEFSEAKQITYDLMVQLIEEDFGSKALDKNIVENGDGSWTVEIRMGPQDLNQTIEEYYHGCDELSGCDAYK